MKKLFISTLGILVSFQLLAQIDPTVEVDRSYDVRMHDVAKPAVQMTVADSLEHFDVSFDYSIFNRQYKDIYEFSPYETAQLKTIGVGKPSHFYARFGTQYPLMPSAELYLQGGKNHGAHASIYARHNSFWGDVDYGGTVYSPENGRMNQNTMDNKAGLNLSYAWETGEFCIDANYNYDKYKYSFSDVGLMDDHTNSLLDLSANLHSAHTEESSVYYDVTFNYRNGGKKLSRQDGELQDPYINELGVNYLKFNGYVGASFEKHRIYIDMNIEFNSYSKSRDFSAGVVELSPIYQLKTSWLVAKLGVKFGNYFMLKGDVIDSEMNNKYATNFFPDVDARFFVVDDVFWIHALVGGGNDINSYIKMLDKCPMISPETELKLGTRPLDTKLAFETRMFGKFNLNLFGVYTMYNQYSIFKPMLSGGVAINNIVADYQDMNLLAGGIEMFWESEDVTAGGSFRINSYKDSQSDIITEMPKNEANAFLRYNFRERIIAEVDCNYKSAVSGDFVDATGESYSVPSMIDMSFNLNVKLNKHFSVYGKIGNILDKRNQYVPLYVEPGRNFGGGVCFSF